MAMTVRQQADTQVRGCVLVIPSSLFQAMEREADRVGSSLEEYILALLKERVRSGAQANTAE